MAREQLIVEVSERGSRVVRRNINEIGQTAKTAQGSLSLLQRALGLLSAGVIIRGLTQLADTFTNIQNRLKTVTTSTGQLNAVTQQLFEISNRTRSSYESTAEVFARVGLSVKELGISQKQTLEFTESLNQAVILSGASAQEAQAGLIQLSQGLASGALRGDELRSVLEQLPAVADVIAKGLGVTRGELRALGQDGKITADIVLDAFKGAREELSERFAKTVPTIGQSFQVLRNQVVRFIGALDQASGASTALAKAILFISDNIEVVGKAVGALALTIGVTLAAKAIPAAIGAIKALGVAIAANPLGALALAVTAAISALVTFSDQIFVTNNDLTTLADVGKAVFESLIAAGAVVSEFFADNFGPAIQSLQGLFDEVFGDVELTFKGVSLAAARGADAVIGAYIGLAKAIVAAFQGLPAALGDIFIRGLNRLIALAEGAANRIIDALNKPFELLDLEPVARVQLERYVNVFEGGASRIGQNVEKGLIEGLQFDGFETFVNNVFDRADVIAVERVQRQKELIKAEQQEIADLAIVPERTFTAPLEDEKTKKAKKAIKEAKQELDTLGAVVEDGVVGAFNTASDAIVDFAQTGKLNFQELISGILADLAKLFLQRGFQQLTQSIAGGAGGFGGAGGIGGVLGSLAGSALQGFATGGSFKVGGAGGTDSQMVAFRATPGERVDVATPAQQAAQPQAPAPGQTGDGLNLKVLNVTSPDQVLSVMASTAGEKVITNWLDNNVNEIAQRIQR
jgi:tape measure domain-containing protein